MDSIFELTKAGHIRINPEFGRVLAKRAALADLPLFGVRPKPWESGTSWEAIRAGMGRALGARGKSMAQKLRGEIGEHVMPDAFLRKTPLWTDIFGAKAPIPLSPEALKSVQTIRRVGVHQAKRLPRVRFARLAKLLGRMIRR